MRARFVAPAAALWLWLWLCAAAAHGDEDHQGATHVVLQGGILHPAGFYMDAALGGQPVKLQFDTSYSSVIVPARGCRGCRVGDRRYAPTGSGNATLVRCADELCEAGTCSLMDGCTRCSARGACCAAAGASGGDGCAFNMRYGDASTGNGTLYVDTLRFGGLSVRLPVGVVSAVSHGFERAYVDGALGVAFEKGACHPGCTPPAMDYVVNQTGTGAVLTFCAARFGGALAVANAPAARLAAGAWGAWLNVTDLERTQRFVVRALPRWVVGNVSVELEGIAQALVASTTSSIAVGEPTMQALQIHFMTHHCDVPKLCSFTTWFKPHRCVHLEDADLAKLPDITILLGSGVSLTITPDDYLPRYRVVEGKMLRCVAFHVSRRLAAKGIGLVLGATVLRRYAVALDRKRRRVAFARANVEHCGPTNGSTDGLVGVAGAGLDASLPMLTADTPRAPGANLSLAGDLARAEACGAVHSCGRCAQLDGCAYWYRAGRCVSGERATGFVWPFCNGAFCACWSVGASGWFFGLAIGVVAALALIVAALLMYAKRQRRYQQLDSLDNEQDIETF